MALMISIDDINKRDDPYQLFLDSIRSPETARKYKKALHKFLMAIPTKLYQDTLAKLPQDSDPSTVANFFVELARKNPDLASNIIATFIKEAKKLVDEKKLHPNSLPNHIKPIKVLLDANRIPIHWKSLYRLYPRKQTSSDDRAYTREELQKMIEVAPDITDNLIIQLFSSGGFRLEAWNYFTWKDVIFFQNKNESYDGAALLVYHGDPESYWTFITPEACHTLELYREKWKSDIGNYPKPDDPLLKSVKYPVVHRLNALGVKKRVEKIVKQIGLRPPLEGKKRHEVPLDHGFRKYFNTMMRRAKVNFADKEDMMGHQVGLERHYERYQEEDFERFSEYQKAILFLTISDEERLRLESQQKQEEIDELAKKNEELNNLTKRIENLEYGSKARDNELIRALYDFEHGDKSKMIEVLIQLGLELRAPEKQKQELWKKMKNLKEGETLGISDFGESNGLSLKNLHDDT
ncbi:MAG: site-specific integrase [Nitrosopumilaceae archaeon]